MSFVLCRIGSSEIIGAVALTVAAAAIGLVAGTASADLTHKHPTFDALKDERAQVRRQLAASQVCGGSAFTLENNVLTCYREVK